MRRRSSTLTEQELEIMKVVWERDSVTVRDVYEALLERRKVAYTTVMTVMDILYRKGVLHRVKHGRAWRYWPVEQREEHDARVMTEVLRSGGNEDLTMRRFVERVSDEEMERLRSAMLNAARRTSA